MAKAQQPGGALTVWLIVFVFFWLVSTVWLVVLYTVQEELRNANARLESNVAQLISDDERNSIELIRNMSEAGPTAVGILEGARADTARLATGELKDSPAVVRTKRDELLRVIQTEARVDDSKALADVSLLGGLKSMYELFKKEQDLRKASEDRKAELEAEVTRLVQLTSQQKADFDQRVKSLEERVATVEAERAAFRSEKDSALANIEKEFEQRRVQADADLTRARQRAARAEEQLAEMQRRYVSLQEKYGELQVAPGKLATARQPDGRILRAVPGDPVVFVDLGEKDRLVLGMQFVVYSATTGIPPDGRGKGRVEVVSISARSSECRIVHVAPGEVFLEGDWIANPVYDRDRSPTFVVLGGFDLNADGIPDPNGKAVMESIIVDWGGIVTSEVTATTDFLVLGSAPPRPRLPSNPTAEQQSRYEEAQKVWDTHTSILTAANNLAVPIMTQETFLSFLGRSARLAQR
jgi:hypothetical protein